MPADPLRLIAPPFTPFHPDGRLNLAVVEKQADLLARTGVDGVFVAGTTGECSSLTVEERMELAGHWVEMARRRDLEAIVQVGDNCQANAVRLAAHAQQNGADATAALAPSYLKPGDVDSLVEFLAPIAAAAGDLPFYFYDIPPLTHVRLPMREFLEKAKPRIPNLVGLKYSNSDLVQLQQCLQIGGGEFQLLFGCDEILLSAVALGVHGAIGSTYNLAGPLYRRMIAAFAAGDMATARNCQLQSVELILRMNRDGYLPACKYAMSLLEIDCGPVRPPLKNLTADQRERLRRDLEQLDIRGMAEPRIAGRVSAGAASGSQATRR
jgi:N-acetylneuraminate lyase